MSTRQLMAKIRKSNRVVCAIRRKLEELSGLPESQQVVVWSRFVRDAERDFDRSYLRKRTLLGEADQDVVDDVNVFDEYDDDETLDPVSRRQAISDTHTD